MRCPTCSDTPHPGFIAWKEVERDGVYWRDLRPCPDCGGTTVTSLLRWRGRLLAGYGEPAC
jgi:hypothetical protein